MPIIKSRPYSKCKHCNGNGKNIGHCGGVNDLVYKCAKCDYYREQDNQKSARRAAHRDANANMRMAKAMEEANRLKALELELLAERQPVLDYHTYIHRSLIMCDECGEQVMDEDHIPIKQGDWVSYTGTKFDLNLVFQGEGLFLGTRKVHGHEHLAYLGEDNKETVLLKSWNTQGWLYREVE